MVHIQKKKKKSWKKKTRKAKETALGSQCLYQGTHRATPDESALDFHAPPFLLGRIEPPLLAIIFLHVPSWEDQTLGLAQAAWYPLSDTFWLFYVRQETVISWSSTVPLYNMQAGDNPSITGLFQKFKEINYVKGLI